jgi:hypothetical protein
VPHKLVVDPGKGHGFGMAGIWPDSLLAWLKTRGIISAGVNVRFKPDKHYQHSPVAVQTSSEKSLRISFQNGVLHRVTIYSITGKRVADFGPSAARQCVWRPDAKGVYLVHFLQNKAEYVERISVTF